MGFGGGSKPKAPELKIPASPFSTLGEVNFASPFASSQSEIVPFYKGARSNRINTTTQLTPELQQAAGSAQQGFGAGLEYLAQNPSQRMADISGGRDLYYNVLADQLASAENKALGRARVFGQTRGLSDSTTQGAAVAGVLDDSLKREREAQLAAFNLGQQTASNQVGTTLGAISGLNNLSTPLGQLVSGQLIQGRQFGDQYAQQKATAEYEAAYRQYQQELQQYNQNKAGWGQAIGLLSPLGAAPIYSAITGDPTALQVGAKTYQNVMGSAVPMLMGGGGGLSSLGSTFGGTNVNATTPSFSPTNQFLQSSGAAFI